MFSSQKFLTLFDSKLEIILYTLYGIQFQSDNILG